MNNWRAGILTAGEAGARSISRICDERATKPAVKRPSESVHVILKSLLTRRRQPLCLLPWLAARRVCGLARPLSLSLALAGALVFVAGAGAQFPEPAWPEPAPPLLGPKAPSVTSGELSLAYDASAPGAFVVRVNGTSMAVGNTRSLVGYLRGRTPWWFGLTNPVALAQTNGALTVRARATDPDGGQWQLAQTFQPSATPGGIEVESSVTVNDHRSLIFLPLFTLLPGDGISGSHNTPPVLAGRRDLQTGPSRSQADITVAGWQRQVPDSIKLTFPLMALAAGSNYVGLLWEPSTNFAALFDSPDRIFQSGGHLMGLIFPGANPAIRQDGSVLPYEGQTLAAGQTLTLRATIIGGCGHTIVPALQQFVARRPLPALPNTGYSLGDYCALAAAGWLDTPIRKGALFRNSTAASGFTPAADAALYMDWLAPKVSDPKLQARLASTAKSALAAVSPPDYNFAIIGNISFPVEALVFGAVPDNAATALGEGQGQLSLFQPDGSILYQPPPGGLDLGKTSLSPDADGLTATHVVTVLEDAVFSGNPTLLNEGLGLLRALDKWRDTVPRGAQTWEVPLHTPDVYASALLTRCYTLGYELTGQADFLEQARYWAWTGLPFVYLNPPTSQPIGLYCTIPVFGASDFVSSWFGVPVQWCGLAYADAIRRLAPCDPTGPWVPLANGIAAAGVQQTHPLTDTGLEGLLPDSFNLRAQTRNAPGINPGTLLPEAIQMFGQDPLYDFRVFPQHGLMVHAPGPITGFAETSQSVSFGVNGWPRQPWFLLINGSSGGTLIVDSIESVVPPGPLILGFNLPATVEILAPAQDALGIERSTTRGDVQIRSRKVFPHEP